MKRTLCCFYPYLRRVHASLKWIVTYKGTIGSSLAMRGKVRAAEFLSILTTAFMRKYQRTWISVKATYVQKDAGLKRKGFPLENALKYEAVLVPCFWVCSAGVMTPEYSGEFWKKQQLLDYKMWSGAMGNVIVSLITNIIIVLVSVLCA